MSKRISGAVGSFAIVGTVFTVFALVVGHPEAVPGLLAITAVAAVFVAVGHWLVDIVFEKLYERERHRYERELKALEAEEQADE